MCNVVDGPKKRKKTNKQFHAVDNWNKAKESNIDVDISRQRGAINDNEQDRTAAVTTISGKVLNPVYYDDARVKKWTKSYNELKAFLDNGGTWSDLYKLNFALGQWVSVQRTNYKSGKLLTTRKQKLDEIGFTFSSEVELNAIQWDRRYEELKKYKEEYGHSNAPRSHPFLGCWIHKQRFLYKQGKLSTTREAKLNRLGFLWDGKDLACTGRMDDYTRSKFFASGFKTR